MQRQAGRRRAADAKRIGDTSLASSINGPDIQALPEIYQSLQRAIDRLIKITYDEVEGAGRCYAIPIISSNGFGRCTVNFK
jgi:hypothetical protein